MNKFKTGYFNKYKKDNINESLQPISSTHVFDSKKVPVFISHKHDDLEDLKGFIGFLENRFNCSCYIDSNDKNMPKTTSGETAKNIKSKIKMN